MVENNQESKEQLLLDEPVVLEEPEQELGEIKGMESVQTLAEAEEETPHQTDLQSVLKSLSPRFKHARMNDLLQPILVSRVFPDNYLDLNYFLVMSMIEELEGEDDIDVVGIVTGTQVGTSIGYEGRGIADRLEIAGAAQEKELETLSKELGLG